MTERITSPTFTLVHVYEGRLPVHHLDVYRLEPAQRGPRPRAGRRCSTTAAWCSSSGATPSSPCCPHDFLEVRLTFGPGDDDRHARVPAGRPGVGAARATRSAGVLSPVGRGRLMLILGITTSTAQVGCAIGGHEGVLGAIHSTRGRRHAETLTPAIEFLCRQTRVELSDIGAIAVDLGPGMFTGLRVGVAAGKALSHARRLPMIGVTSLDLLAFPLRHSPPADRRAPSTPAAARSSTPATGSRPAACSGSPSRRSASPDDLASELPATGEEVLLAGDGALRYQAAFEAIRRVELADRGEAYPLGRLARAARPRPGPPRGVRQPRPSSRPIVPAQARRRDQLDHARRAPLMAVARLPRPTTSRSTIGPMRRRHLAVGAAHRAAGVPPAVVDGAVHERARLPGEPRVPRRPASAARSSATAG